MSDSPQNGSSTSRANSSNGDRPERTRLTDKEKKANHITSEQKRRQAIREGFDRLTDIVPGLEGQGRSESIVLRKTVEYMREQLEERAQLIAEAESLGLLAEEKPKNGVSERQNQSASSNANGQLGGAMSNPMLR